MNRTMTLGLIRASFLMTGLALGAGLMYMLDPDRGGMRRARVRDRAGSLTRVDTQTIARPVKRQVTRARGVLVGARARLDRAPATDTELADRVRAVLAGVAPEASSIQVTAHHGQIILSGPILAGQVQSLVEHAAKVHGVRHVDNHLTVYQNADDVPGLQGQPTQA